MRITVYDCTQKSLIGNEIYLNLDQKQVEFANSTKKMNFDNIIIIGNRRFIVVNPNMSIWCRSNIKIIPENEFWDRSFVIKRDKKI